VGPPEKLQERIVTATPFFSLKPVISSGRSIGSVGQADLAPLAELADAIFRGMALEAGEGTALLDNNAFSTGWAALAVADVATLLDTLDVAGALSLDGLAANPTMLHPAIAAVRPYPGLRRTLERLRELLDGSAIWDAGVARNLQDPLTFRNLPQIQGACRDVLDHVDAQIRVDAGDDQAGHEGEGNVEKPFGAHLPPVSSSGLDVDDREPAQRTHEQPRRGDVP